MSNYTARKPWIGACITVFRSADRNDAPMMLFIILITLITVVVICSCSTICCYKRGFKQGQKSNKKNDQQEQPAQYEGHNTSNEISDQEHAYEKPHPPTIETSQNHQLELSAYEEVRDNRIEECQYQKIGEDVYLTPVFQQHPLSSVGTGN